MRRNGFLSFILVVVLAMIAGGIGYAFGVNSAVSTVAATGDGTSTVVVANAGWHGFWFFPFFGIFFVILFFGIIFSFVRHAAWGGSRGPRGGGWRGYGYGPYGWTPQDPGATGTAGTGGAPGNVPPGVEQMLKDWHRDAHGTSTTDVPGSGQPPGPQG